jgi:cell division protein FtsQ
MGGRALKEGANSPAARSWRDIPQNVKPRAMSREGRRRVKLRALRITAAAGVLGLAGWGAWEVAAALRSPGGLPVMEGGSAPVRDLTLTTDGVLDKAWLARTLALPRGASLMELDLEGLRSRLLASGQARTAAIVRKFPSTLAVTLSERSPVARLAAPGAGPGGPALLVARDGIAYHGSGYDPAMTGSLPWLVGANPARPGGRPAPIAGMGTVADLLNRAQLDAAPIYRTWKSVDISRLETDGEIVVLTGDGLRETFGTQEDFYRQLAKLDLLLDAAAARPGEVIRDINLSLGGQVSVAMAPAPAPPAPGAAPGGAVPAAAPSSPPPAPSPAPVLQFHIN